MYDQKLLKEKYGFSADDYGSWTSYLKDKVKLIRKHGLEAVKMNYNGFGIYNIYSYKGDCKFDVVVLTGLDNGSPQVVVDHYNKEVSFIHGYMGRGKSLAKRLGYKYRE